ncbi:rhodanese-like domain-containing protein [Actinomadura luteofluorescens]|uniref:rhodanese-like domain-containing protein n=1 Tax=Actinomadura luteofluorescens TaxID=46163 RepID=UPI0021647376|nr:rhodanese-like domain-containing protein [Actinomadura glauciflava]MCR3743481.1 Rhodanese-related sulfurtransferase [Actinomadura glauciflava]
MSGSVRQLVTRARDEVRNLSVPEVADALEGDAVALVDLREPDEVRREGAIPGAIQAPRGMLEFWADPASPYHREEFVPSARTILYCASGGRSALAAQTLQVLGYTDVAHLDGGLAAWKEQGRPVTFAAGRR